MSNIDKDIEIEFVKEKIEECTRIIQSVSNMESKKAYSKERTNFKKVLNLIENKDKAIETWKEIAEILASEYAKHVICRNTVGGISFREVEQLLDWARKEVDKNDN